MSGVKDMQTGLRISLYQEQLSEFCQRWRISELAVFGSAIRNDFQTNSDVDVLVTFVPQARWSLFDLVKMQDELGDIFGREVDMVEREAIERSENYFRRKSILRNIEVIFAKE